MITHTTKTSIPKRIYTDGVFSSDAGSRWLKNAVKAAKKVPFLFNSADIYHHPVKVHASIINRLWLPSDSIPSVSKM